MLVGFMASINQLLYISVSFIGTENLELMHKIPPECFPGGATIIYPPVQTAGTKNAGNECSNAHSTASIGACTFGGRTTTNLSADFDHFRTMQRQNDERSGTAIAQIPLSES
jgi:hypothetical protein